MRRLDVDAYEPAPFCAVDGVVPAALPCMCAGHIDAVMLTRDEEHGSRSSTTAAANASEAINPGQAAFSTLLNPLCLARDIDVKRELEDATDARVDRPSVHPEW